MVAAAMETAVTAPEVRTWQATTDAEWRCVRCDQFLAYLDTNRYITRGGARGTLPATLTCRKCGHSNHIDYQIVRVTYIRT